MLATICWGCFICPNLSPVSEFPGLHQTWPARLAGSYTLDWAWPSLLRQLLANALKKCSEIGEKFMNLCNTESIITPLVMLDQLINVVFLISTFYPGLLIICAPPCPGVTLGSPPAEAGPGDTNIFCLEIMDGYKWYVITSLLPAF